MILLCNATAGQQLAHLRDTLGMPGGNLRTRVGLSGVLLAFVATSKGSFRWFLSTCNDSQSIKTQMLL